MAPFNATMTAGYIPSYSQGALFPPSPPSDEWYTNLYFVNTVRGLLIGGTFFILQSILRRWTALRLLRHFWRQYWTSEGNLPRHAALEDS